VCAGNIVLDILARPADVIPWGATQWVDSIEQSLGGNGASTACTLAKLGAGVRLMGMTGGDAFGDAARARLHGAGVDLSLVARSQAPTATTVVLVNSNGARALLHRPGCSAEAFTDPIDFNAASGGRFHLANPFALKNLRAQAASALRRAREAGLLTSLDTGWDPLGEWMALLGGCLSHLDIVFVNEDESRMLAGTSDPDHAARFFLERGVGMAVIKLGGAGCAVYSRDGSFRVPAYGVRCVDTTGAGDCFAGGFLAALEAGDSVEDAARLANAAGALSVQSLGATTGILSRPETLAWMRARSRAAQ
jgi:sugar/nucleoside kinase (ribokinase family)